MEQFRCRHTISEDFQNPTTPPRNKNKQTGENFQRPQRELRQEARPKLMSKSLCAALELTSASPGNRVALSLQGCRCSTSA